MNIAIPVTGEDTVDPRWGKAHNVAVAKVGPQGIAAWDAYEVDWDTLHDQGPHGTHHGRIVRFLKEHDIDAVVINHAGPPMMNTMAKMGLKIAVGAQGSPREAVLQAAKIWEAEASAN